MSKSLFGPSPAMPAQNPPAVGSGITALAAAVMLPGGSTFQPGGGLVTPTPGQSSTPVPGPNAFEVVVASHDPDAAVLVVRVKDSEDAEEVEAVIDLQAMTGMGSITVHLGDSKLAPKIEIKVSPRVTPPKFTTIEEAEQWMEANA